ncbi:hypothetical protein FQA39_LY14177 [Lamprigera yunnana]|nr:hypothetical protein FQA39_LY14177 [Lamprigera yunnana]
MVVRVGSNYWNDDGHTYSIESLRTINNIMTQQEIVLIRLNDTIMFSKIVAPVFFKRTPLDYIKNGKICGWLPFTRSLWTNSTHMIETEISIWNQDSCNVYKANNNNNYICGNVTNKQCNIVPSGPILLDNALMGIWYSDIPCQSNPFAFNNVNYVIKWFDEFDIKYH